MDFINIDIDIFLRLPIVPTKNSFLVFFLSVSIEEE